MLVKKRRVPYRRAAKHRTSKGKGNRIMENSQTDTQAILITLTADIVSAYVANHSVATSEFARLISNIYAALSELGGPAPVAEEPMTPAVSIRSSVRPDYIVCLEDGKKLRMLKRHLRTHYNLTPEQYRARWNLPADYPMVAPSYAEMRRVLAVKIGLGRKPDQKLGRKPKAK